MFQETSKMKEEKGKSLIDSNLKIKFRDISRPLLLFLTKSNIKYKIVKENSLIKEGSKPIVYAVNHFSAQDTPIASNLTEERAYVLAGKQNMGFLDNFFFKWYGSIFVDRKDKEDMALSKEAAIQYLAKDKSLLYFPEGTWNLSDNLLALNMKWGIIDVVKKANAQLIPICLEYDKDKMICHAKYGEPLIFDKNTDNKEAITALRDTMATMKWDMYEKKGIYKRAELDIEKEKKDNKRSIEEYPKIDIEYESSIIYNPNPSNEEVFAPVKKLTLNKKNAFLFRKDNSGIW